MLLECRELIGDPPRELPLRDWFYWRMVKPKSLLQHGKDGCHEIYRNQRVLRNEGRVVWGVLVQANSQLFQPGPTDSPAMIVYSPRPEFDGAITSLGKIAKAMFSVKGTTPDDPEVDAFAAEITNERVRSFQNRIPRAFSGKWEVYQSTVMVARKHLPKKYLTNSFFPLLICPEKCRQCMILPSRFWAPALQAG